MMIVVRTGILLAVTLFAQALAGETKIVGSSTVSKFANVSETRLAARGLPVTIETTGTGGGFALFCSSADPEFAPVTLASRPIKNSERETCDKNSLGPVQEHVIGLSGVVVLQNNNKKPLRLTQRDLFLALAAQTPEPENDCRLIDNPRIRWNEVREGLPAVKIEVYGPPSTSGTRASFIDLAIAQGAGDDTCMQEIKQSAPKEFKAAASKLRTDGAWIDAGENDAVIVAAVRQIPHALGIVGYPVFVFFKDVVDAAAVEGVAPARETIASEAYPLSRSLRVYAKSDAIGVNPAAKAFLDELTGEAAIGPDGYLIAEGLIPVSAP